MSVEAIVAIVGEEAAAEAERIVADARARAAETVAAAEQAVADRLRIAVERADPAARAEAMRLVNASRLRLLGSRAERTAALVDAAFIEARLRLDAISDAPVGSPERDRWGCALRSLLVEAVEFAGHGAIVTVRARDVPLVAPTAGSHDARLADPAPDDAPAGVVVRSADGRTVVDSTLPARLGRARVARADLVARGLGLEA